MACAYPVAGPTSEAGGVLEETERNAPRLSPPGFAPVTGTSLNSGITQHSKRVFIDKTTAAVMAGPVRLLHSRGCRGRANRSAQD